MPKRYLRKIVVDGESYLWYRTHHHLKTYERSPCVEILTVYSLKSKLSPLRIRFREEDNTHRADETSTWYTGYPESGVLWLYKHDTSSPRVGWWPAPALEFNLNRPKVVAALIHLLRTTQWNPTEAKVPLDIENGLSLLDEHSQTLRKQTEITP